MFFGFRVSGFGVLFIPGSYGILFSEIVPESAPEIIVELCFNNALSGNIFEAIFNASPLDFLG